MNKELLKKIRLPAIAVTVVITIIFLVSAQLRNSKPVTTTPRSTPNPTPVIVPKAHQSSIENIQFTNNNFEIPESMPIFVGQKKTASIDEIIQISRQFGFNQTPQSFNDGQVLLFQTPTQTLRVDTLTNIFDYKVRNQDPEPFATRPNEGAYVEQFLQYLERNNFIEDRNDYVVLNTTLINLHAEVGPNDNVHNSVSIALTKKHNNYTVFTNTYQTGLIHGIIGSDRQILRVRIENNQELSPTETQSIQKPADLIQEVKKRGIVVNIDRGLIYNSDFDLLNTLPIVIDTVEPAYLFKATAEEYKLVPIIHLKGILKSAEGSVDIAIFLTLE